MDECEQELIKKQSMPRQGTEITVTKQGTEINQKQSMPRQGTETPMNSVGALSTTKQSTPRQGTERGIHLRPLCYETINAPSGDGNSKHPATFLAKEWKQSTPR